MVQRELGQGYVSLLGEHFIRTNLTWEAHVRRAVEDVKVRSENLSSLEISARTQPILTRMLNGSHSAATNQECVTENLAFLIRRDRQPFVVAPDCKQAITYDSIMNQHGRLPLALFEWVRLRDCDEHAPKLNIVNGMKARTVYFHYNVGRAPPFPPDVTLLECPGYIGAPIFHAASTLALQIDEYAKRSLQPLSLIDWLYTQGLHELIEILPAAGICSTNILRDLPEHDLSQLLLCNTSLITRVNAAKSSLRIDWAKVIPIRPCNNGFRDSEIKGSQVPYELCHSQTVHALQGSTLLELLSDLGEREIHTGATHVTFSRVSDVDKFGILNIQPGRFSRSTLFPTPEKKREFQARQSHMACLRRRVQLTLETLAGRSEKLEKAVNSLRAADVQCSTQWQSWLDRSQRFSPGLAANVASLWLDGAHDTDIEHIELDHDSRCTRALGNLGNSCYQNVVLQTLAHCPVVLTALVCPVIKSNSTISTLTATLRQLWLRDETAFYATDMRTHMGRVTRRFCDGSLQDASDFLNRLLEQLNASPRVLQHLRNDLITESQKSWSNYWVNIGFPSGQTQLSDVTFSQLRTTTRCTAGHLQQRFTPFVGAIPLVCNSNAPCSVDLKSMLSSFDNERELTGTNAWECKDCKSKVNAVQRDDIWSLSDVIFFQLDINPKVNVIFSSHLDLSPYVGGGSTTPSGRAGSLDYTLFAVINYSTSDTKRTSGHYTATIRSAVDGAWYLYDDMAPPCPVMLSTTSNSAYILCYYRHEIDWIIPAAILALPS
jgi:ubiquitin C-terminal hydrolase